MLHSIQIASSAHTSLTIIVLYINLNRIFFGWENCSYGSHGKVLCVLHKGIFYNIEGATDLAVDRRVCLKHKGCSLTSKILICKVEIMITLKQVNLFDTSS